MPKIISNTTLSDITISDTGITIPASGSYTIAPQDYPLWSASTEIDTYINNGNIVVNDGYDNLKPQNALLHIHEESIPRQSMNIATTSVLATTNSTLTLNAASRLVYIFTGTTAGQIVQLPSATTLNVGHKYEIWNTSNQSITVRNASGIGLFVISAAQKTWFILQDNSTTAGTWQIEANYNGGTGGGNGILNFGYNGSAATNRWLEVIGNNPSNNTPFVVAGAKAIRSLSVSTDTNSTATITLFLNGVAVETISVTAARKNTKLNLNIPLVDLDTLSARVTAGTISRPMFTVWL